MSNVKKKVEEFPEDVLVRPTFSMKGLDETSSSTNSSTDVRENGPSSRFHAAITVAFSFGLIGLLQPIWWLAPWPMCIAFLHFFREWFRLHGATLTRRRKAFFNWTTVLTKNPNFIPGWEFKWYDRYNPLIVNCCGGEELTADEPETVSPRIGDPHFDQEIK